jgi:DNA-directed RNA polymerase specialized sigma24 family protein
MKNPISDARIKRCIRSYQGGDRDVYAEIVKLLSPYMYNYPRIVFAADPDCCSDFYEYMLNRLQKVLGSYRETDARFSTWFTVVLRSRYINFVRERATASQWRAETFSYSLDYSQNDKQSLYSMIAEPKDYIQSHYALYDELVERIVSHLNRKHRIFFHLYYIESLRPEDVVYLSFSLGREIRDVLHGIGALKNTVARRYKKKNENLGKLGTYHRELIKAQRRDDKEAMARIRKKRDSVIAEYQRIKIHPSYEGIAGFLAVPLGTVSTGISRMKGAVRNILEELYHEKLPL